MAKHNPWPRGNMASAIASMLARGPQPKEYGNGIMLEEEYEGQPCIVLRDDSTMTGKPIGYRPINPGESSAEARDAVVRTIAAHRDIVVTEMEADAITLQIDEVPGL